MNQDQNQDRDCPTCIHNVADWRLCSREDQEKLGVWTEPDGPSLAVMRTGGGASLGADALGGILGARRGIPEIM